jgi:hypothetical protein
MVLLAASLATYSVVTRLIFPAKEALTPWDLRSKPDSRLLQSSTVNMLSAFAGFARQGQ